MQTKAKIMKKVTVYSYVKGSSDLQYMGDCKRRQLQEQWTGVKGRV